MTLEEFSDKLLSFSPNAKPASIYVFEDEDSIDNWVTQRRSSIISDVRDYYLSCVIQGDTNPEYYLNKSFCEAKVDYFYAVEPNVVAVLIRKGGKV